jgi:16S rRNA (uracil1498-N3)-methyltransferase
MARLNAYHLPPDKWPARADSCVTLSGPEARHLLGVLRARPGEELRLFDGRGRHGLFRLLAAHGKDRAELMPLMLHAEPAPTRGVALALGWNKSSRRDWLLEKSVELGALGLMFWQATRSQGDVPAEPKDSWRDKLVQAAKQCHAAWLPELSVLSGGADALARIAADYDGCYVLYEKAGPEQLLDPQNLATGRSLVVLGPEGGLEEREAQSLVSAGFTPLSLGPRPLRWETAALCCLALSHHALLHD